MAKSSSDLNQKILKSAVFTVLFSLVFFYLGDRYGEALLSYGNEFFTHWTDAFGIMVRNIASAPFFLLFEYLPVLVGGAMFLIVWMIWLRYVAFIGNYRFGEESGSARWGTLKEGKSFKDTENSFNNLIFTENYGLALSRKKFDLEKDRNLNVLVVGGSGSGKTYNYVTPNICQLNTSYFITDPKGTLLQDAGFLFAENGYEIKVFNTIFDGIGNSGRRTTMHYNPLKYVQTDADILSFVNCFILNTNGEASTGDPFWENAERMLYTALIALLRDYFPEKDYNLPGLLKLLACAEASENDEDYLSPLDRIFKQIETGKCYCRKQKSTLKEPSSSPMGLSRSFASDSPLSAAGVPSDWVEAPSQMRRRDGKKPADAGGFAPTEDFALMNYKNFKVAADKTLKSIIISCNVRLDPIAISEMQEMLSYDEMGLDTLGDCINPETGELDKKNGKPNKTVVFGILSDTDKTFSFLFAIMMWQCIDQLCRKALMAYGGKLPYPVHFIFNEFANIGTIPQIEETIAVTRSRNIGITVILQSMSQLESKDDKKAQTIVDCCDTLLFLGGKSNSTNKEIAEMIGKQTIHQTTYNESTGQNASVTKNLQIQGRDLIDAAEIGKMSRREAIVLIAGTNPLRDKKYTPSAHPNYKYIADPRYKGSLYKDRKFDLDAYLKSREKGKEKRPQAVSKTA